MTVNHFPNKPANKKGWGYEPLMERIHFMVGQIFTRWRERVFVNVIRKFRGRSADDCTGFLPAVVPSRELPTEWWRESASFHSPLPFAAVSFSHQKLNLKKGVFHCFCY